MTHNVVSDSVDLLCESFSMFNYEEITADLPANDIEGWEEILANRLANRSLEPYQSDVMHEEELFNEEFPMIAEVIKEWEADQVAQEEAKYNRVVRGGQTMFLAAMPLSVVAAIACPPLMVGAVAAYVGGIVQQLRAE